MRRRRRALAKYALPVGVAAIAAAPALAAAAPATFAAPVNYPLGQVPSMNLGIGDFNADGHVDVASGALNTLHQFVVLPGAGDGTFGAAVATPAPVSTDLRTVATGDLNNDGKPDLVFQSHGYNDDVIGMNQTTGGAFNFTSPVPMALVAAPQAPGTPALGDVNEDGKLDLVQPGYNGGLGDADTATLRLGVGDGTFGAATQIFTNPTPGAGMNTALTADVNGDGHLDVLGAVGPGAIPNGSVLTALGNGDGTFQMPASRTSTGVAANPYTMAVADLNGDGHPDVLVSNGATTSMMMGNGDGTFGTATVDSSLKGYGIAVADLNGDGIGDLATAGGWQSDSVDIALGNGDGTFATATQIPLPVHSYPYGLALADVNGDGLTDVLTDTYGTQNLVVLINTSVAVAPAVASVAPATGPDSGGTSVTITGTAFTGATAVTFGGVNATSFTVNSPTSITAVAPPHAAGAVAIAVTTSNGTGTGAGLFTYTGAPAPTPTPDSGGGSLPTATTQPTTPGRLSMSMPRTVRGRTLISTGVVPAGADRVVQTATGGASSTAHAVFGAWATARAQTTCPISTANGRSIFTCTLRLASGRWTVSTKAMSGTTTVATSSVRVRMKTAARLSVTG